MGLGVRTVDAPRLEFLVTGFGLVSASETAAGSSVFSVTVAAASFGLAGVGVVRRLAGRRVRGFLEGTGFAVDFSEGFTLADSGAASAASAGFASGLGSGVGVVATSVGAGSGSAILAPVEVTRLVLRPPTLVTEVEGAGVSVSSRSSPPKIGSNDPLKES